MTDKNDILKALLKNEYLEKVKASEGKVVNQSVGIMDFAGAVKTRNVFKSLM